MLSMLAENLCSSRVPDSSHSFVMLDVSFTTISWDQHFDYLRDPSQILKDDIEMDDSYDEFLDVVADMVSANCHLNPCGVRKWGVDIGFIVLQVAVFILESEGPVFREEKTFPVHMVALLRTDRHSCSTRALPRSGMVCS